MRHILPADKRNFLRITGTVYTPAAVAESISRFILSQVKRKPKTVLEPSVGDGSFLASLHAAGLTADSYLAVDINENALDELRVRLPKKVANRCEFGLGSFLSYFSQDDHRTFDLVVGNPPFIRRHNFGDTLKAEVSRVAQTFDYSEIYLKNAWAAFLLSASQRVSPSGLLAFIVPYELLTVDYGQRILERVAAEFARVDVFVPDERAFKEIEQDAVAIVAQRRSDVPGTFVNRVISLSSLDVQSEMQIFGSDGANLSLDLKSFLFDDYTRKLLRQLRFKAPTLSSFCVSAPGIVSGANDFFIVTKSKVDELRASAFALPILKKSALMAPGVIFERREFEHLSQTEPSFLLDLREVSGGPTFSAELLRYLANGADQGLDQRYKTRHRQTWFHVPIVKQRQGFFFKRAHSHARVCINEANVYITDTAYGIEPNAGYTIRGICFSFYNSLTMLFSEIDGRFYGGGVLELSPNEFKGLPLVYHEPSDEEFATFIELHRSPQSIDRILDFGDAWLSKELGLKSKQLRTLRQAWQIVRNHRMRHSSRGPTQVI